MVHKNSTYQDLIVWQKSMQLVVDIYDLTKHFPKTELFGITNQLRRASVNIPSNIAEGSKRTTKKDFRLFIHNALGSAAEVETQLDLSFRLGFLTEKKYRNIQSIVNEVIAMLVSFSNKLNI